ncbi:hypothetical protein SALBM135S_04630 [Streptomyces alboniger]
MGSDSFTHGSSAALVLAGMAPADSFHLLLDRWEAANSMNFQAAFLFLLDLNRPRPSTGLDTWTRTPAPVVGLGRPRNLSSPSAFTWSW